MDALTKNNIQVVDALSVSTVRMSMSQVSRLGQSNTNVYYTDYGVGSPCSRGLVKSGHPSNTAVPLVYAECIHMIVCTVHNLLTNHVLSMPLVAVLTLLQ